MVTTLRLGPTGIRILEVCYGWQPLDETPAVRFLLDHDLLERQSVPAGEDHFAYRTTSAGRLVVKMANGLQVRVGW